MAAALLPSWSSRPGKLQLYYPTDSNPTPAPPLPSPNEQDVGVLARVYRQRQALVAASLALPPRPRRPEALAAVRGVIADAVAYAGSLRVLQAAICNHPVARSVERTVARFGWQWAAAASDGAPLGTTTSAPMVAKELAMVYSFCAALRAQVGSVVAEDAMHTAAAASEAATAYEAVAQLLAVLVQHCTEMDATAAATAVFAPDAYVHYLQRHRAYSRELALRAAALSADYDLAAWVPLAFDVIAALRLSAETAESAHGWTSAVCLAIARDKVAPELRDTAADSAAFAPLAAQFRRLLHVALRSALKGAQAASSADQAAWVANQADAVSALYQDVRARFQEAALMTLDPALRSLVGTHLVSLEGAYPDDGAAECDERELFAPFAPASLVDWRLHVPLQPVTEQLQAAYDEALAAVGTLRRVCDLLASACDPATADDASATPPVAVAGSVAALVGPAVAAGPLTPREEALVLLALCHERRRFLAYLVGHPRLREMARTGEWRLGLDATTQQCAELDRLFLARGLRN